MFKSVKFYIIVGHKNLIIKKEEDDSEKVIEFASFIPNVPFYYHFFDKDKNYVEDMKNLIKKLKIKNATIIVPDDSIDIEVDIRIFTEFFMFCGVKKVQVKAQCYLLSLKDKKYVSLSKNTRNMTLQYVVNNKSIAKKYYDTNYMDMEQISIDIKNLHTDCQYESIPVYINNVNADMEKFKVIGSLVSLNDIAANIVKD